VGTLYKVECDLFDDQQEVWSDDMVYLPRPSIDGMYEALIGEVHRRALADPKFPDELVPQIRELFRIVPVLEGEEARRYLRRNERRARARGDKRQARFCASLRRELERSPA